MDILEYLIKDHDELRRKSVMLGRFLGTPDFRTQLLSFVSHYELHEEIEEQVLFPAMARLQNLSGESIDFDYEKDHTEMWRLLRMLKEAEESASKSWIHRRFEDFQRFSETHMRCEEEILFTLLRDRLPPEELEDLGAKAQSLKKEYLTKS